MKKLSSIILGIETSCDETSAAVVRATHLRSQSFDGQISHKPSAISFQILSNIVMSQIAIHKKYGGIVPEVAARNHVKNIIPALEVAIKEARVKPADIDRIAVTYGPGLITSLMVGVQTARSIAYVWKKPVAPVDHIKAHVFAACLGKQVIFFPAIALVVSGGHTELLLVNRGWKFRKIGQTVDDAAGEAFDKVAKMLGLGFPGGPAVEQAAQEGNSGAIDFPRPMIRSKDYNFSFAGLKTAVLYTLRGNKTTISPFLMMGGKGKTKQRSADICASFQQAVVDVLVDKTMRAAKQYKVKTLIIGGGVAANTLLRKTMKKKSQSLGLKCIVPEIKLCTDNAAPIAAAGYFEKPVSWKKLKAEPNLER